MAFPAVETALMPLGQRAAQRALPGVQRLHDQRAQLLAPDGQRLSEPADHGSLPYTMYVEAAVAPPRPVQLVWKNAPRGRSVRS